MTELEHIEIEGFKGLEHVEFEPSDINLITGRNNTGKTSFLEAVDLFFNPRSLENFDENIDSVIHVDFDRTEICGETDLPTIKTNIRYPSLSEAETMFFEIASTTGGFQMSLSQFTAEKEESDAPKQIYEEIRNSLANTIKEKMVTESTEGLQDEILILSTTDNEYPCFLGGERSTSLMRSILEEIVDEFSQNENVTDLGLYHNQMGPRGFFEFYSRRLDLGLPPENTFINQPELTDSVTFIQSTNPTERIGQADDNQEPIKTDDISDYIKQTGIVDNLKTFTLDYLVFEDETGEKNQIPFDFMGDGFKSIVGLLWELMDEDVQNDIVLLEEPETHMHPGYIREVVYFLINLAREEDVQLFITTHDSDFINGFFTENLTDEEEAYLEDEFSLLRMEEDSAVVEDYATARENLKDLHLDLRGI
ncbi:ATP-dependent nuclease [Halorussus amylolyticus]|uniref:ATP-dependent nuclease n=1 Tax=Halorussus amylolyticus TaxID=1126242 RepID=UPI0010507BF3|nr:ATP-binding protein [Halorussus amylolyticus]